MAFSITYEGFHDKIYPFLKIFCIGVKEVFICGNYLKESLAELAIKLKSSSWPNLWITKYKDLEGKKVFAFSSVI